MSDNTDSEARRQEKRQHHRSAILAAAQIEAGGRVFGGQVLNVSAGGALFRIAQPFSAPDGLTISIDGAESLHAALIRSHAENHGVAFVEDPARVDRVIDGLRGIDKGARDLRVHPRVVVSYPATLSHDGQAVQCSVLNLSLGGAFVRCELALPRDTELVLDIVRFGSFRARVARSTDSGMGCLFRVGSDEIGDRLGDVLPLPV
jgi:hypothetical protein